MAIATLSIDIVAKLASLERDMGKAAHIAEKNAARMESAFTGVKTSLAAIGSVLTVGAFAGMVRSVADAGDQLQKLSTKTGAAVEELSKLQYAASLSDVSNEDLSTSLGRLNKVLGEAADGSKQATEALARFGIAPGALNASQAFEVIADRVKNTGDQTKIASAMNDIFGRSWDKLVPMIKGGSEGLRDAGDELERMGGVLSGDLAKASEQFNDNITRLNTQLEALKLETLGPLIPLFLELSNSMVDAADKSDKFADSGAALKTIFETITVLGANVAYVFKQTGAEIGGMAAQLKAVSTLDFEAFSNIGEAIKEDAKQARAEIDALTYRLMNPYKDDGYKDRWNKQKETGASISGTSTTPKPLKVSIPKVKTTKTDDDLAAFITDLNTSLRPAEQALESFRKAQLDAAVAGADLTNAEKQFYDLINSDDWKTMSDPWKELVATQFEAANSAEKAAEQQKQLNDLIAATPTAKLEEAAGKLIFLADAYNAAKISAEQLDEASQAVLATIQDDAKKSTDAMSTFAEQAARNMQDAFADFLFDPFEGGVDEMLSNFGTALQRMIAEAVAADLASKVFGKAGGGEGDGLLSSGINWLLSALPKFDVGTPYVPYDMPAIIHKGERIVPAAQNKPGSSSVGQSNTINVYVSGTSAPDVRRAAGQGAREALAAINGAGRYR